MIDKAMRRFFPAPIKLSDSPELAVLRVLKTTLEVTELALLGAYPDSSERGYSERRLSEQEAYAIAMLYQIDALGALLNEYVESIRRLHEWRNGESDEEDIAF